MEIVSKSSSCPLILESSLLQSSSKILQEFIDAVICQICIFDQEDIPPPSSAIGLQLILALSPITLNTNSKITYFGTS